MKDAYKKCKNENKQSGNERRSFAFYEEFGRVLSVRNVVKLPQVCNVGVAEELAQSPPEYHVDHDTILWLSRKRIWGKQREPKKENTWFERI